MLFTVLSSFWTLLERFRPLSPSYGVVSIIDRRVEMASRFETSNRHSVFQDARKQTREKLFLSHMDARNLTFWENRIGEARDSKEEKPNFEKMEPKAAFSCELLLKVKRG